MGWGWWWCGGGTAVENYTASINQLYPTVFLSSRVFPFPSRLHHISSLLYLSFTVVHLPALVLRSHRSSPRLLPPPLDPSCSPCTMGFIKAPLVTITSPLSFLLHFHCGLFTCILYWSPPLLLPARDLSPVHGTVLAILEIDLFPWARPDIACCWAGMNLLLISFNLILFLGDTLGISVRISSSNALTATLKWLQMSVNDTVSRSSIF